MIERIKLPTPTKTQYYINETTIFSYLQVCNLTDEGIQQKINHKIYDLMINVIGELTQPDFTTYITGFYEIKTNQREVLSITLNGLGDFHGAHPSNIVRSLSFDVTTGKAYKLGELFKPNSGYLKKISDIIAAEIKRREIPLLEDFEGISPEQDYYIADKNLIIYFQQYQITPYYVGLPYFSIPLYDISDMIVEDNILDRMLYWL